MRGALARFLGNEKGGITVEMTVIMMPLLIIVLTVLEVGISFYVILSAQKAAQLGARYVVAEDPIHTGVPTRNVVLPPSETNYGEACFVASGTSPCNNPVGPDDGGWECDGAAFGPSCDAANFTALITTMQIVYPSIAASDVVVRYDDEQLGVAGGPFQPHVQVTVKARPSPLQVLSLIDLFTGDGVDLREVTASAFGGDLNSNNDTELTF